MKEDDEFLFAPDDEFNDEPTRTWLTVIGSILGLAFGAVYVFLPLIICAGYVLGVVEFQAGLIYLLTIIGVYGVFEGA